MTIKLKVSLLGPVLCSTVLLTTIVIVLSSYANAEQNSPDTFSIVERVKIGPDFKPLYKGKIIPRHKLNLTDLAKRVKLEPDYYAPGEGPEDDDDEEDNDYFVNTPIESSSTTTTTTTTTTTAAPTTTTEKQFSIVDKVKVDENFKPLYKGKIIPRHKLNLTDLAKRVKMVPDYYAPGEGPDDEDEEDTDSFVGSSVEPFTSTTTTTSTTMAPITKATVASSTDKSFSIVERVKIDDTFKPAYNGKIIPRHKLNLTDLAKRVKIEPDYYAPGEGPEEEDNNEESANIDSSALASTSTTTTTTTTELSTSKQFSIVDRVKIGADFKPLYKGKIIPRYQLNLTDLAKRVKMEPDYYEPGEGPEDDDEEEPIEVNSPAPATTSTKTSTTTTTTSSATTKSPSIQSKTQFSIVDRVKIGDDFKPLYKGKIIPRYKLNLTDLAKRIKMEPDYYDEGEGPEDYEEEETETKEKTVDDDEKENKKIQQTKPSLPASGSTTTVSTEATSPKHVDYEDDELSDVDMAVGGISGIVEKIMQGPKKNEINDNSTPEEVYLYLRNLVQGEFGKAMKATIPRIYDHQFPIGNMISQRCFNSFVQFGERFRNGYTWPAKMMAASSSLSFNNFALRDYGNFDRCLNVVADDADRRHQEQFFTGQYCMMQLEVPLPPPKKRVTYMDQVLHFNGTEMAGTFEEFLSLNSPFLYSNPLSMAICVPSTCMPSEIEDVIHYFLKKFHFKVRIGLDCYSKANLTVEALPEDLFDLNVATILEMSNQKTGLWTSWKQLTRAQSMAIFYILCAVLFVFIATAVELYRIGKDGLNHWISTERNRPKTFLSCFSIRYNLQQMLYSKDRYMYEMPLKRQFRATTECPNDIEMLSKQYGHTIISAVNTNSIDGLKVFALLWICLANFFLLGYQSQMLPSVANVRELVLGLKESAMFQIVTQSWLSMEIFFLLSGFLLAYTALPYIARHDGRPNLFFFLIKRLLRFVPSIIFILLFIYILPLWKNAGPLYNSGVAKILQPCKRFYIRNLFFVTNLGSYEDTCLPQFWYLGVEFQLFVLGIFVTIFAYNRRRFALKTFIALILAGIIIPGYIAFVKKVTILSPIFHNAILDEIPNIIKELNFSVGVHFSAYFAGLAIGYYARMSASFRVLVPQPVRYVLWILLPTLSIVSIYLPLWWPFKSSFKYNQEAATVYFAIYRILFIGTFAWIIYETIHSRAVLVRCFLSSSLFRICSQISFQIYLFNLLVIWIYFFTRRHIINSGVFDSLSVAISLFGLTVLLALVSYFLFEAPCRSLFRYYMESPRVISLINPQIQTNGCLKDSPMNRSPSFVNELNLSPNFYFSPHYNMITNCSSRAGSETASLSNFSMCNPVIKDAQVWSSPHPQQQKNGSGNSTAGECNGQVLSIRKLPTSVSMIKLDETAVAYGENEPQPFEMNTDNKDSNNNGNSCEAHINPAFVN